MIRYRNIIPLLFISILVAQSPKYELRAVWISSASGDWPKSTDVAEQQRSLIEIFDVLKNNNFNTVFFQVRPRGNVLYRSVLEPWVSQLTGVLGKDPGYDPLAFAIEEAHKRGLELHAWFNVAKVWGSDKLPQHQQHITRSHHAWVKLFENEWWVDMGIPEARDYTENLVKELVSTYDIDGLHFDYIRYPSDKFEDWDSFTQWSDGVERAEWRRNNITTFVKDCYTFIQKEKPWIKVGSAPLGIYQSINGAQSSFNGYSGVFQDARRWLREGIHDYVAPQLYWSIGEQKNPNDPDFFVLSNNWMQEHSQRHVYIGIGAYRENIQHEIREQILMTRAEGAHGQAFFRYENVQTILPKMGNVYRFQALVPSMIWKDSIPPLNPKNIAVSLSQGVASIRWNEPDEASDKEKPCRYVLYRSSEKSIDTRRAENILAVLPASQLLYRDETSNAKEYFYTVTAVDRAGNESGALGKTVSEIQSLFSRYGKPETELTLSQNIPNPVNGRTYVTIKLPQKMLVTLSLKYASALRETIIVRQLKEVGTHIVAIDTKNIPSGTIEYRLRAGEIDIVKTMEKK
ncbi:MAG: family 10 glycosylhydrolase [Bacteroidota bacterium]